MDIFVEPRAPFTEEVKYTLRIFAREMGVVIRFTETSEAARFRIDSTASSDFPVALEFYQSLHLGKFDHRHHFQDSCQIRTSRGEADHLATAFYMLNSFQEYAGDSTDDVGRFKFTDSYQHKFNNVLRNLVADEFAHLARKLLPGVQISRKSKVYLTHDIDTIHGALLQDGFHLIKRLRPLPMLRLIFNVMVGRPDWLNMDKIMAVEDEYSLKSTFYWLVTRGAVNSQIRNSDYNINDGRVRRSIKSIEERGFENGLHKSISPKTFREEVSQLPFAALYNRNHYLKLSLPRHYEELEESGLKLDTTLGFAEQHGFRNSHGLPFTPFDLKNRKPFTFVEAPLLIMDGTFQKYYQCSHQATINQIIDFFDKHRTGTTFTILWHNTFFTEFKFKGYLKIYKEMLSYLKSNDIAGTTSKAIVSEFSLDV